MKVISVGEFLGNYKKLLGNVQESYMVVNYKEHKILGCFKTTPIPKHFEIKDIIELLETLKNIVLEKEESNDKK